MKSKRIMPLLLSVIMTVGTATAVPFTASAVETNAPVVSAQSAKTSLATPKISKAESVYGGVKISWGKVNGAEKYRVYYKGSKGWTRMVDTTSTSCIDKDVSAGKTYIYTVRCINSSATKFTSGYDAKGVTVTTPVKPSVKPTKTTIKLDKTKVTLGAGEPCTLKATVNPSQKVTWTSSNPKLVKVDSNGKLTVTKDIFNYFEVEQTVKITAKAGNATATCTVTTNYERVYHKYAIVPVYKEKEVSVCKGCGRLISYSAAPGTKYETEDGRKGIFLTKEDHIAHAKHHMNESVPSGWYSEVVMLKVGERVQREGWYVD